MAPIRGHHCEDSSGERRTPKIVLKFHALGKGERFAAYLAATFLLGGTLALMLVVISSGNRVDLTTVVSNIAWFAVQIGATILTIQVILHQLLASPHRAVVDDANTELVGFLRDDTSAATIAHLLSKLNAGERIEPASGKRTITLHNERQERFLSLKRGHQVAQSFDKKLVRKFQSVSRLLNIEGRALEAFSSTHTRTINDLKKIHSIRSSLNEQSHNYELNPSLPTSDLLTEPPNSWSVASIEINRFLEFRLTRASR